MDGIFNIYKEAGFTSFDVVAKLRGILKQKKIGHTGTLDPDAEGVLPVCIGKATKVCEFLTDKDKEYETVLYLGIETDTQDISGEVLNQRDVTVTEEQIRQIIGTFVGEQKQIPPMYSALKVNGQKLCDLARKGIEVERKAREIEIFAIEIIDVALPRVSMRVHCSKGTYIRTLCHDIGQKAGCGGCMEQLLRTRTGSFTKETALTLKEVEQIVNGENIKITLDDILVPVDEVLSVYPKVYATAEADKLLQNGNRVSIQFMQNVYQMQENLQNKMMYRMYNQTKQFIGVFSFDEKRQEFKPEKMFL